MKPTASELADKIDMELDRLCRRVMDHAEKSRDKDWRELAALIKKARFKSFSMLTPEQQYRLENPSLEPFPPAQPRHDT